MVRFRRDVGSLFSFIKASAILHQAQRQVDAQGRVVATEVLAGDTRWLAGLHALTGAGSAAALRLAA